MREIWQPKKNKKEKLYRWKLIDDGKFIGKSKLQSTQDESGLLLHHSLYKLQSSLCGVIFSLVQVYGRQSFPCAQKFLGRSHQYASPKVDIFCRLEQLESHVNSNFAWKVSSRK